MAFARVQRSNTLIIGGDGSPLHSRSQTVSHEVPGFSNEALFVLGNIDNQLKVVTELIDRHFASATNLRPSLSQSRTIESEAIASQLGVASNMKTMLSRQTATTKETLRHFETRISRQHSEYKRAIVANQNQELQLQNRLDTLRQEVMLREANLPFSNEISKAESAPSSAEFEADLLSLVSMRDRLLGHIEEYSDIRNQSS